MKVVQGAPLPLGVSRQKEALNFAVEVKESNVPFCYISVVKMFRWRRFR